MGDEVPVEWVNAHEWAAIEQALAAASEMQCGSSIKLVTGATGLLSHGGATMATRSGSDQLPTSSVPLVCGRSIDGECGTQTNTTTGCIPLGSKCGHDDVRAPHFSSEEDPKGSTNPGHQFTAVDADIGIRYAGVEKGSEMSTENRETNDPPKKLRRTLPWGQSNGSQLQAQNQDAHSTRQLETLQREVPADALHTMGQVLVQTNLSQLTNPWPMANSACQGKPMSRTPSLQFKGRLVYSKTETEVEAAACDIWEMVRAKRSVSPGALPMGFDMEWKASFQRGEASGKVAVVQLCIESSRCDVMHVAHSGIPPSLASLLEDSSILKTGVGSYGDAAKLRRDYGIQTRGVIDLSAMANQKLGTGSSTDRRSVKPWSLSSLAQELTCKQVEKVGSIRTGDWEACPLSPAQLLYAATDAFASLYLYQILETFPDRGMKNEEHYGSDPVSPCCGEAS